MKSSRDEYEFEKQLVDCLTPRLGMVIKMEIYQWAMNKPAIWLIQQNLHNWIESIRWERRRILPRLRQWWNPQVRGRRPVFPEAVQVKRREFFSRQKSWLESRKQIYSRAKELRDKSLSSLPGPTVGS